MPVADHIRPFQASRPSGPVFIGLNILRLLSVMSLILVFAANIVTLADDIKAIKADNAAKSAVSNSTTNHTTSTVTTSTAEWDCDYFEYSTVPDQTGGEFWSILNRLFIIFQCILLALSEFGVPKRLFDEFIPVLGSAHGLGCLGVLQALLAASVLSHYCDMFPQVSSWLLFIIGCFNIIAGLVFRANAKSKRLIFSWENPASLTPQTRLAASAWDFVTSEKPSFSRAPSNRNPSSSSSAAPSNAGASSTPQMHEVPLDRPGTSQTNHSDTPLLPENTTAPGARFGGFGFGRQADKAAADRGWKISRPVESLPRYAI